MTMKNADGRRRQSRYVRLLLIVPYIAVLGVPLYNRIEPSIAGIPFFYWYLMLWIPLGALLLLGVYVAEKRNVKSE